MHMDFFWAENSNKVFSLFMFEQKLFMHPTVCEPPDNIEIGMKLKFNFQGFLLSYLLGKESKNTRAHRLLVTLRQAAFM